MPSKDLTYNLIGKDVSLSTTLSKGAAASESMASRIGASMGKIGNAVGGGLGDILNKTSDLFNKMGEAGASAGAKLTAAGSGALVLGTAFQMMGSKDQQAASQLKQAVIDTGGSFSDYSDEVEKAISQQENYGHSAADTQNALTTLTTATGSTDVALKDLTVTANLAAIKHESLADAASQVAKIQGGTGSKILKQYGVDMTVTAGNTAEATIALGELNTKISGQASAAMDSFSGKVDIVKTKLEDAFMKVAPTAGSALQILGSASLATGAIMDLLATRNARAAAATALETVAAQSTVGPLTEEATAAVAAGEATDTLAASEGAASVATLGFAASLGPVGLVAALGLVALNIGPAGQKVKDFLSILSGGGGSGGGAVQDLGGTTDAGKALSAVLGANADMWDQNTQSVAAAQIKLDSMTPGLVKSGISVDALSSALGDSAPVWDAQMSIWEQSGKLSGSQINQLNTWKATADSAYSDVLNNTKALAAEQFKAVDPQLELNANYKKGVDELSNYQAKMAAAQPTAIQAQLTTLNFADSVSALTTQIAKSRTGITGNTDATRANQETVLGLIQNINDMAQASADAGDTAVTTKTKTDAWNASLLNTATKGSAAQKQIQGLINTYEVGPKTFAYNMILDADSMLQSLGTVDDQLAYLQGLEKSDIGLYDLIKGEENQFTLAQIKQDNFPGGGIGGIPGYGSGGVFRANEYGAELMHLGTGRIYPTGVSQQMMNHNAGGGGNSVPVTINVTMPAVIQPDASTVRMLVTTLENWVNGSGGKIAIAAGIK